MQLSDWSNLVLINIMKTQIFQLIFYGNWLVSFPGLPTIQFLNHRVVSLSIIGRQRRKGREGKGREGKGREGKGREGKGREGKGREGKGREGVR